MLDDRGQIRVLRGEAALQLPPRDLGPRHRRESAAPVPAGRHDHLGDELETAGEVGIGGFTHPATVGIDPDSDPGPPQDLPGPVRQGWTWGRP